MDCSGKATTLRNGTAKRDAKGGDAGKMGRKILPNRGRIVTSMGTTTKDHISVPGDPLALFSSTIFSIHSGASALNSATRVFGLKKI